MPRSKTQLARETTLLALSLCAGACSDDGAASDPRGATAPPGSWFKGDLHLHSSHSTDALDNPVDVVIAKAESLGMDYFTFTDHDNHVDGNVTTWDDPAYASSSMLVFYGIEYT